MQGVRVRIYCDEGDRVGHQPLHQKVVETLWNEQASGVTVFRAVDGFGGGRVRHNAGVIESALFAIVIEWVDSPERFDTIWPVLRPLVSRVLVTTEQVELVVPPHRGVRHFSHTATLAEIMQTDVTTVGPDVPIVEVVRLMRKTGLRFLPVAIDGRLFGVISNGDLVTRGGLSLRLELHGSVAAPPDGAIERTASDVMTRIVVTAPPNTRIYDAGRLMLEKGVKRLPVVKDGRLLGVVSRVDLLRTVADARPTADSSPPPGGGRTIADIAQREVPVVRADTPVSQVLDALVSTRLNRVVVVDDKHRVLGIISDTELLKRIEGADQGLLDRLMRRNPAGPGGHHQKTAGELMISPVVTVSGSTPIGEAIARMLADKRKLLPVVDEDGRLYGMVDRADALNATFPDLG